MEHSKLNNSDCMHTVGWGDWLCLWRKLQSFYHHNIICVWNAPRYIMLFLSTPLLSLYMEIASSPSSVMMCTLVGGLLSLRWFCVLGVYPACYLLRLVVDKLLHHADSHVNLQPHRAVFVPIVPVYVHVCNSLALCYFHSRCYLPHRLYLPTKALYRTCHETIPTRVAM